MPSTRTSLRTAAPHIVHVARECAEIAAAGGVGDVVLQLALECARQGFHSTIFLPHYGRYSAERQRALAQRISAMLPWQRCEASYLDPVALDIPMAYAARPYRTEPAAIETIALSGPVRLQIAQVVADRFAGKQRPYAYTGAEARAILEGPRGDGLVCGAEAPPPSFHAEEGTGHFDHFAMNLLLQKAALAWTARQHRSAVVHCHDAHAAMLPMMAKLAAPPAPCANRRFVVTAHNCGISYRQRCGDLEFVAAASGLPLAAVSQCVIEGEFDPFGAAALYADHFNTVSDSYAWEVQGAHLPTSGADSELHGFSEFLARNAIPLEGIANGVSAAIKGPEAIRKQLGMRVSDAGDFGWKPAFRKRFARRISKREIDSAWRVRSADRHGSLRALCDASSLFTCVGRWSGQKGVDIAVRAAQEVLGTDAHACLCILGEGNQPFVFSGLLRLVAEFPGRVVVVKGFSDALAAQIYAAGDFLLAPSRFEPCGLIDMIAQLNGNLPIVNQVGGLAKVIDGVTGFGYFATTDRENLRGLVGGMRRALSLAAHPDAVRRMQLAADREVRSKYNWTSVLERYARLYGMRPPAFRRALKAARPRACLDVASV
ncbi:MAG: glycogen/starch synthase [Bryobacterales bacterium]|nr:glycogen/starch synthase [Bryobacterales bacterium]